MGVIQTFTNYWYRPGKPHLTEQDIRNKAQKLTLYVKQAQYRLQQATILQEQQLIKFIKQEVKKRNKVVEQLKMENIIKESEKMLVYDELVLLLSKIINEARILEIDPQKISNECVVAINSLIFLYDRLELGEWVTIDSLIPTPHPQITIEKTSPLIQKYLDNKKINHYELNLYAVQLSKRKGLQLELFNEMGHQFVADPQQPIEESPSARMFAVTLTEVELAELQKKLQE